MVEWKAERKARPMVVKKGSHLVEKMVDLMVGLLGSMWVVLMVVR
jgi:hypothetical protein